MPDAFTTLRQYMPEWMATRGSALLGGLPPQVEQWVQEAAKPVVAFVGPPERSALSDEIVERFGQGFKKKQHAVLIETVRSAVLLVAIQQLPPPNVPGEEGGIPADTKTKKMDRVALKRSRMLGMIETGLQATGDQLADVLAKLG